MAGSGVRYRYKGRFVSAQKAVRLGNLSNARKYLTSEYTYKNKADHSYKGYKPPLEKRIDEALKRDRSAARQKREAEIGAKKAAAERRKQGDYERERKRVEGLSERAAATARDLDISIPEALDAIGFDPEAFAFFDAAAVERMAGEYQDYGDEFFDFDMVDLEDEDKYAA